MKKVKNIAWALAFAFCLVCFVCTENRASGQTLTLDSSLYEDDISDVGIIKMWSEPGFLTIEGNIQEGSYVHFLYLNIPNQEFGSLFGYSVLAGNISFVFVEYGDTGETPLGRFNVRLTFLPFLLGPGPQFTGYDKVKWTGLGIGLIPNNRGVKAFAIIDSLYGEPFEILWDPAPIATPIGPGRSGFDPRRGQ